MKLTEKQLTEHEEDCRHLGLISALRQIENGEIDTETNQMKVNLPDCIEKFETGNGEGIWATPYTDDDLKIFSEEIINKEFQVVLLNQAITFPFPWGSVITVKNIRPECRPVLSRDWIEEIIAETTCGEMTLLDILQ